MGDGSGSGVGLGVGSGVGSIISASGPASNPSSFLPEERQFLVQADDGIGITVAAAESD